MGMAAMLVMWPRPFEQLFFPKGPGGCIWNLVAIRPVVSEEKSFEIVEGRRMTEPAYTISSPGAFGSGELRRERESEKILIHSSHSTKAIVIDSVGTAVLRRSKQFEPWARCWKCQLSSMPVLPLHKNSYIVNQIVFLNYDPYQYEYFSKCTFYVVTHVCIVRGPKFRTT